MKAFINTTSALVCIALLSCLIVTGCATSRGDSAAPPPGYMTQAVLKSFENVFSGSWAGVRIFIEKNAYLPNDLKKVGLNEVEITDRDALFKKFEYEETAPAIALIEAWEADGVVTTRITYQALKLKYAKQTPKGGVFEHTYRLQGGQMVMLTSSRSME